MQSRRRPVTLVRAIPSRGALPTGTVSARAQSLRSPALPTAANSPSRDRDLRFRAMLNSKVTFHLIFIFLTEHVFFQKKNIFLATIRSPHRTCFIQPRNNTSVGERTPPPCQPCRSCRRRAGTAPVPCPAASPLRTVARQRHPVGRRGSGRILASHGIDGLPAPRAPPSPASPTRRTTKSPAAFHPRLGPARAAAGPWTTIAAAGV